MADTEKKTTTNITYAKEKNKTFKSFKGEKDIHFPYDYSFTLPGASWAINATSLLKKISNKNITTYYDMPTVLAMAHELSIPSVQDWSTAVRSGGVGKTVTSLLTNEYTAKSLKDREQILYERGAKLNYYPANSYQYMETTDMGMINSIYNTIKDWKSNQDLGAWGTITNIFNVGASAESILNSFSGSLCNLAHATTITYSNNTTVIKPGILNKGRGDLVVSNENLKLISHQNKPFAENIEGNLTATNEDGYPNLTVYADEKSVAKKALDELKNPTDKHPAYDIISGFTVDTSTSGVLRDSTDEIQTDLKSVITYSDNNTINLELTEYSKNNTNNGILNDFVVDTETSASDRKKLNKDTEIHFSYGRKDKVAYSNNKSLIEDAISTDSTSNKSTTLFTPDVRNNHIRYSMPVGTIYVMPPISDMEQWGNNGNINTAFVIPLQSTLKLQSTSRAAAYNSLQFFGRIGDVKQYSRTESPEVITVSTEYYVERDENDSVFSTGYTLKDLQDIEIKYKSLVLPVESNGWIFSKNDNTTKNNGFIYFTRPPIINVVLGTDESASLTSDVTTDTLDSDKSFKNLFTEIRFSNHNYKYTENKPQIYYKNYVVTSVSINKDPEKYDYFIKDNSYIDTMGFGVELQLMEIDDNYINSSPSFNSYYNTLKYRNASGMKKFE